MTTPLYAHTRPGLPERDWETFLDHARATAERAGQAAAVFGCEKMAHAAGLLHDLGKIKPEGQRRLRRRSIRVSHSTEGALEAERRYGGLGRLLAFGIAGHHSGLPNGAGPNSLRARMGQTTRLDLPEGLVIPDHFDMPPQLAGLRPNSTEGAYALQFLTRMLFSCLVDADHDATASFYGQNLAAPDRPDLRELRSRLIRYLTRLQSDASAVSQARVRTLMKARMAAAQKPGLFSLTVPAGGGKTLSALAFALDHAIEHGLDRVIFVIPHTSIVDQTAQILREALACDAAVLEHHANFEPPETAEEERIWRRLTETWDSPIIVTTAVQFFETLHASHPMRCLKLYRMARSVIIVQEPQTLPLDLFEPGLAAIHELARGYGSSIVLSGATQPAILREDGFGSDKSWPSFTRDPKDPLAIREISAPPAFRAEMARRIAIEDAGPVSNAMLVHEMCSGDAVLTVVNTRAHAAALFQMLRDIPGACHLSRSMTPLHRREVLTRAQEMLCEKRPIKLVSTSLVDSGVDFDFPRIWRAVTGIDSIARTGGLCNRERRLMDPGKLTLFRPETKYGVSADMRMRIEATERILQDFPGDPLGPEAVRAYFQDLFLRRGDTLDARHVGARRGILRTIRETAPTLDFPFADIARAFRMIEPKAAPILILGGDYGLEETDLMDLWDGDPAMLRKTLQMHSVQIPRRALEVKVASGEIRSHRLGGAVDLWVMDGTRHYDAALGLSWD